MLVSIDFALCEGNGICEQLVPEVFHVDERGDLHLLDSSPPESMLDGVRTAVRSCPRGAISILEGVNP